MHNSEKKSIDQTYAKYDDRYSDRLSNENRFREVIDIINDTFDHSLNQTAFSRVPLFYTLFCAIYHYRYGLPQVGLPTPKKQLNKIQRLSLTEAVQNLSELIEAGREGAPLSGDAEGFVNACLRQTDNIKPRQDRLKFLYERAFVD